MSISKKSLNYLSTHPYVYTLLTKIHITFVYPQDELFPLYYASQEGYDGIVEMLLQAGSKVDLQIKVGIIEL